MDPMERRSRLLILAEADPRYREMKAAYDKEEARFLHTTRWMPAWLRNRLHGLPGMAYFLHHQVLNIVCDHMRFPDEL